MIVPPEKLPIGTSRAKMAYFRRTTTTKRKYVRRKPSALTKVQKKQVRSIVKSAKPKEYIHLNGGLFNTTVIGNTYTVMSTDYFTTIPTNIIEGGRKGNKIQIHSVQISGRLKTTNATVGDVVTLCVLRQDNPGGNLFSITPGDYFQQNTAGFAPLSLKQDDTSIKCVWKKTYTLGPSTSFPSVPFFKTIYFKKPLIVLYTDGDSLGAIQNTLKNQMCMFGACINASVTSADTAYTVVFSDA